MGRAIGVTIPRVVPALLQKRVPIIGSGENFLNIIFAADVARGAILAANHPAAVGQAYNLCSEGEVRQRDLLDTLTDVLALPRITKRVPYWAAIRFAFVRTDRPDDVQFEAPRDHPPRDLPDRPLDAIFHGEGEDGQLCWKPEIAIREGVRRNAGMVRELAGESGFGDQPPRLRAERPRGAARA